MVAVQNWILAPLQQIAVWHDKFYPAAIVNGTDFTAVDLPSCEGAENLTRVEPELLACATLQPRGNLQVSI